MLIGRKNTNTELLVCRWKVDLSWIAIENLLIWKGIVSRVCGCLEEMHFCPERFCSWTEFSVFSSFEVCFPKVCTRHEKNEYIGLLNTFFRAVLPPYFTSGLSACRTLSFRTVLYHLSIRIKSCSFASQDHFCKAIFLNIDDEKHNTSVQKGECITCTACFARFTFTLSADVKFRYYFDFWVREFKLRFINHEFIIRFLNSFQVSQIYDWTQYNL